MKLTPSIVLSSLLLGAVGLLLAAGPAAADPVNGDFSSGGSGWSDSADPGLGVSYPTAGGNPNGYARLESDFTNAGGQACIEQTFECGLPGGGTSCTIGFDFFLEALDALPGSARLVVEIDGIADVVTDVSTQGWEFVSYVVPCGTHTVRICLVVDPSFNSWAAGVDNVRSECTTDPVANEHVNWSTLKSMYD